MDRKSDSLADSFDSGVDSLDNVDRFVVGKLVAVAEYSVAVVEDPRS